MRLLMWKRSFLVTAAASIAVILFHPVLPPVAAQTAGPAALIGQVSSNEEGRMEGVLVSAKKAGSTITTTVVSNQEGRYSFPRERMESGRYNLHIRAAGYDLENSEPVEIAAGRTTSLDLKLRPTRDLASQLNNTEWLMSMPGTHRQKTAMLGCLSCHSLERIVRSRHDADEWAQVIRRMRGYYIGSTPRSPQRQNSGWETLDLERFRSHAEYLSTINLNKAPEWPYSLKTLPRPKGRATRVIITEYDLPRRETMPHDVIVDPDGMAWYADFGAQYFGKLDPKTGKVTEYSMPVLKPESQKGILDVELDQDGNIWFGMMRQAGLAKFDRKTEKVQTWSLPPEANNNRAQVAMVMPWQQGVDGKVWTNNVGYRGLQRFDMRSGAIETINPYTKIRDGREHSVYGIAADSQNNLFFLDIRTENIGRRDAKTGEVTLYPTPTPNSGPRRGHMDSQDRFWFAEFRGNRIAVLDTRTKEFQEWESPTPWANPYDAVLDKNGEAWAGGMSSDLVMRLDPKTGQITEYPLPPQSTNIRRVFVDNATDPVTFWVGENNGASIIKLEPLD